MNPGKKYALFASFSVNVPVTIILHLLSESVRIARYERWKKYVPLWKYLMISEKIGIIYL